MKNNKGYVDFVPGLGLTLTLLVLVAGPNYSVKANPALRYVALDGDDGRLCDSIADRCRTVQRAIDVADPFDEIRVAAGTYTGVQGRPAPGYPGVPASGVITQVVYISKTVAIRGGYTTAFTDPPDPEVNQTTLDAQGGGRGLVITGDISPTVEGLRITGGDASGLGGSPWGQNVGAGIYVMDAAAAISNNRLFSNTAEGGGGLFLYHSAATLSGNTVISNTALGGGGLFLFSSAATLSGNTVASNVAVDGGGLFLTNSDATLNGNVVVRNTAYVAGGGLYLDWSNATLNGNIFTGNTTNNWGGGLWLHGSDATLINNVVADNQGNSGSGMYIRSSSPDLLHTTIAHNSGGDGSGVYITDSTVGYSTVALTNTILVSHSVGISVTGGNTATVNGILWDNITPITVSLSTTATVLVQNEHTGTPAFVSADTGDYHLGALSDAINRGVRAGVAVDIDGQPRLAVPDLGADEYVLQAWLPLVLRQFP